MDDLKKAKLKKIDNVVEKVVTDFNEANNRYNLDRLYERKESLKRKINSETSEINKANARLQLNDVEKSIDTITGKIDLYRNIDVAIDEDSAKKYIEDNPDIFLDSLEDFDYD